MTAEKPLVLDVDGTFLKTDILFECFWAGLGKNPRATLRTTIRNLSRPAVLKRKLAKIAELRTDLLPVNEDVHAYAKSEAANGRQIVLASASDVELVRPLAEHHGFSEKVFGSDGQKNLKGAAKAAALVRAYGEGGFDYAGNENADLPVWEQCDQPVIVGNVDGATQELQAAGKDVVHIPDTGQSRDILRALRPHQWVKNILLVLPLLAAHEFGFATLALALVGIVAFSAAASLVYVVNDLLDLEADRLHATKHKRPFASGAVPIKTGMAAAAILGAVTLFIGSMLGAAFLLVIICYLILSLAYSLRLKRMRWLDIIILAALYTIRVIAGAAATQVEVSVFMLAFVFPVFLTLGCVKRLTELTLAETDDRLPGRGYGRPDRRALLNLAIIGVVGSVLIFFLYSLSDQARELYPLRWILWLAMVPITLWLVRMLRLGYFGKQDYDPIVFAMRDKRGIGLLLITLSLMFYAAGLWQQWFGF